MEKQNVIPPILRAKTALTFLIGAWIGTAALIVSAVSKDCSLLVLGGILFFSVSQPPFRRYKKVCLTLADGKETTLLLGLQTKIKPGTWYRFYFQSGSASQLGNEYLDAALSTNVFLGCEECAAEPDTL